MKASLDIPDALFRRAKSVAAERGIPLRELVTEALAATLQAPSGNEKPWERERIARYKGGQERFGSTGACPKDTILTGAYGTVENGALLLVIEELGLRKTTPAVWFAAGGIVDSDNDEPLSIGVREGFKQDIVDDAEDRRYRSDAESQRENRSHEEGPVLQKTPNTES